MPPLKSVKTVRPHHKTVGVIASPSEFRLAVQMPDPPDLFELRLDCLFPAQDLEKKTGRLPAPYIITARHPAEGGENNLRPPVRRELLGRFLPNARYIDIELRSAAGFRTLLDRARGQGVEVIISFHDYDSTPSLGSLHAKTRRAALLGAAVFKVVTRTDNAAQLGRLLEFALKKRLPLPVSSMGIGNLGVFSRILLARCGAPLVYTSLGKPRIPGQIPLTEWRKMTE